MRRRSLPDRAHVRAPTDTPTPGGASPSDPSEREIEDGALPARADLYLEGELHSIVSRAMVYLRAGLAVHFRGPAGVGKTTLALRIADLMQNGHLLVTGDDALTSGDLVGRELGYATRAVHDTYIHSVRRTETETRSAWVDSVLTRAMVEGRTLVYDEFTRASAAANNALLTALEERVLVISNPARGARHVIAHPEFRVIFTSNPLEYAGTNRAPDALLDRMITFDLIELSAETEAQMLIRRTGLEADHARQIVALLRQLKCRSEAGGGGSLRPGMMIARILRSERIAPDPTDGRFVQVCLDILGSRLDATRDASDIPGRRDRLGRALRATFGAPAEIEPRGKVA
ncbi:MAG: AAA family ATPase [Pseudomonadota bacterium]